MKKHVNDSVDCAAIEAALGFAFQDKSLLAEAFTHQSYANGRNDVADNQRLEFLGDAVLGLLCADKLYRALPGMDEGFLTVRRSHAVSGEALAEVARCTGLAPFMRFSPGVRDGAERSGTRTLAALVEAVFGAAWLDGGLDAVRGLFEKFLLPRLDLSPGDGALHVDPRGELQTYALRAGLGEPKYETTCLDSDGSNFLYRATVRVGDASASATGGNTRKACAAAARAWLADNVEIPTSN